jgi:hypothetical protein
MGRPLSKLANSPIGTEQELTDLFKQNDIHWRDYIPFHEYFHGENGAGIGASHQTGWTGIVAKLIQQQGEYHKEG